MSLHKVPYTKVVAVNVHPNAHSLELLTIYGFQVVAKKGQYKVDDPVVFVPVDSILPAWLEAQLFPHWTDENGILQKPKISLLKSRIRQIRIRKFPSQGMVISPADLAHKIKKFKDEEDYAEALGIIKYEPPYADHTPRLAQKRNKPLENPRFHQYKGCENIKWYPNLFQEGDQVIVQEKHR